MYSDKNIDLEELSMEQVDELAQVIGSELVAIAEETRVKVESLLSKYNLSCKINISLVQKAPLE